MKWSLNWQGVRASLLFALVLGFVLPALFFFLFSFNTTATRRDIFPELDDPLEVIGFVGLMFFGIPTFFILIGIGNGINAFHQYGLSIPIFDTLSLPRQTNILLFVSLIMTVLLWFVASCFFRGLHNKT